MQECQLFSHRKGDRRYNTMCHIKSKKYSETIWENLWIPDEKIKTPYENKTGHKIQVEIWNGCGIPNLAMMYRDFLRHEGLDVMDSKNADHYNYLITTIIHHRGDINRAMVLADILKVRSPGSPNDSAIKCVICVSSSMPFFHDMI